MRVCMRAVQIRHERLSKRAMESRCVVGGTEKLSSSTIELLKGCVGGGVCIGCMSPDIPRTVITADCDLPLL